MHYCTLRGRWAELSCSLWCCPYRQWPQMAGLGSEDGDEGADGQAEGDGGRTGGKCRQGLRAGAAAEDDGGGAHAAMAGLEDVEEDQVSTATG